MKTRTSTAFCLAILISSHFCFGEPAEWKEVFNDVPSDVSKWSGPELNRVSVASHGFVFSGGNMEPNIVIGTNQRFTGTGSIRITFSNVKFGTGYNNAGAFFDVGLANDVKDMAFCLRMTRFGDGGAFVCDNTSYDLTNRPYLEDGKVAIQMTYDAETRRILVQQLAGKYKPQGSASVAGVTGEPVTLFDKVLDGKLDLGTAGYPLMIAGASRGNGGYTGEEGATISDITVETNR